MTNSELLKSAINNSGFTMIYIAKQLKISYQTFYNKINNKSEFKASEIILLCSLLNLEFRKRENIFFDDVVDFNSTARIAPIVSSELRGMSKYE